MWLAATPPAVVKFPPATMLPLGPWPRDCQAAPSHQATLVAGPAGDKRNADPATTGTGARGPGPSGSQRPTALTVPYVPNGAPAATHVPGHCAQAGAAQPQST